MKRTLCLVVVTVSAFLISSCSKSADNNQARPAPTATENPLSKIGEETYCDNGVVTVATLMSNDGGKTKVRMSTNRKEPFQSCDPATFKTETHFDAVSPSQTP